MGTICYCVAFLKQIAIQHLRGSCQEADARAQASDFSFRVGCWPGTSDTNVVGVILNYHNYPQYEGVV